MSRIGNAPINLPEGVEVKVDGAAVSVKGKKGELFQEIDRDLSIEIEDNVLTVKRPTDQKRHKAMHGLYRSLINNMVVGVSEGYKIELELVGVGFRASNSGQVLEMALGFSHPVVFLIPAEVKVTTEMKKGSPPLVILESNDKQLIGQVAARIRSIRKPEPYKGKGIRFKGEVLRRKEGKTAAK
ncbi:MAG: 50S ribosomal protein L6 [Bacteroidota bacterium]|nr:50S ribosomal protein L6 [Bacteroidota bacterium]MEC8033074.1 50S ribosomal protein L6 [Bacteroidota bacterium]